MNKKLQEVTKIAYSYESTVYHSYRAAKEMITKGIPGSFIECGVGAGAQIAAMQLAVLDMEFYNGSARRQIFAFDSYKGIPLAGPHDADQPGIPGPITHDVLLPQKDRLVSSGVTVHSVENVKKNLAFYDLPLGNIAFIEGWFQDTLPFYAKSVGQVALLRLDGDLYESTFCCLKELFPVVSWGGMVIIDDYALPGCQKAVHDFFKNEPEAGPAIPPTFFLVKGGNGPVFFYKQPLVLDGEEI